MVRYSITLLEACLFSNEIQKGVNPDGRGGKGLGGKTIIRICYVKGKFVMEEVCHCGFLLL